MLLSMKYPPNNFATIPDPQEEEEIQECAVLRPEERLERFWQVSEAAWAFFSQNPNRGVALALRDERSPESWALWQRLMSTRPYRG